MFKFLLFVMFLGVGSESVWAQSCPPGWELKPSSTLCRAKLPSDDYFYPTGANDALPVCGTGRIPVMPNFEPRRISTNTVPNSIRSNSYSANPAATPFPYSRSAEDLTYLYDSLTRCVCHVTPVGQSNPLIDLSDSDAFTGGNYPGNFARVYPDTYETIVTQDQDATVKYNRVAYAANPTVNGRTGSSWSAALAQCGCPNLNEETESNATTSVSGIIGEHCVPRIQSSSSNGRVLMTYNSIIHSGSGAAAVASVTGPIIIDESSEGLSGVIPDSIQLPTANGSSQEYKRKIWVCAPPYRINQSGDACELMSNVSDHQCGAGGIDALASPVSSEVSGATMTEKFNNTVNKRLACCMNENGINASSMFLKYDCVDNSSVPYSEFDELWESNEEGLSNAVVMSNALGEYINGFYTLSGAKCSQYSDFGSSASYKPKRLTKGSNGQWIAADLMPGNRDIFPHNDLSSLMIQKGLSIPSSPSEMVRCPVLVRVATVMTCPAPTKLPALQRTFTPTNGKTRCSSAASVKLHVRIEQLHEIQGVPTMKPVDTIQEKRLVSSISVEKIIVNKSQGKCPAGATLSGETCVYR